MSYLLLHNLEDYTYKNILESYKKDGYIILYKEVLAMIVLMVICWLIVPLIFYV